MVKFIKDYKFRKKAYKKNDTLKCSKSIQDELVKELKVAEIVKEK